MASAAGPAVAAPKGKAKAKAKAFAAPSGAASEALADLITQLEDARNNDDNSDVKKLKQLKEAKIEAKREAKRLAAEGRKMARKRKAMLARTEKASTEELLETLRIRMQRRVGGSASSADTVEAELPPSAADAVDVPDGTDENDE